MTLKESIIDWILLKDQADYFTGVGLYAQAPFNPNILRQLTIIESPQNKELLKKHLGELLLSGSLDQSEAIIKQVATIKKTESKVNPVVDPVLSEVEVDEIQVENVPMDNIAKINLDIDSLIRMRVQNHNSLHDMTKDKDRQEAMGKLTQIQDGIEHKKHQIKLIKSGQEPVKPEIEKSNKQDDFEVPTNPVEAMKKLNRLRKARSLRKKTMATNPEGSDKYEKALKEYAHFDKAVNHINEKIKAISETAA